MKTRLFQTAALGWLLYLGAITLILLTARMQFPTVETRLMAGDNDDLMRLVSVRDWLGGQGWFDLVQHRLLPPEGVLMHWSRYVDAGIAAILLPASWLLPWPQAELLAATLWPSLLAILAVLVVGNGSRILFGPLASAIAVATLLTWVKLAGEFQPGRIDHHNLQLLCAMAILYLALLPGRPWLFGAGAGALTAFSLAIGLEMLPFLALIWGLAVLRHALARPDASRPALAGAPQAAGNWLLGFALALAGTAPLLMAGQTPVSGWLLPQCDALAPPMLALIATGCLATTAPVLLQRRLRHALGRLLLVLALTAFGIWLAWPLLGPCATGPYASIAPETRKIIDLRILEGQAFGTFLRSNPNTALAILLPPALIGGLAGLLAWQQRAELAPAQKWALLSALVILAAGMALALTQVRASNIMAPALPLLAGFLVTTVWAMPKAAKGRAVWALLTLLAMPATLNNLLPPILGWIAPDTAPRSAAANSAAKSCRSVAAMKEVAALPPGSVVFSSLNLGAAILAYTPQSATSAPYHRSNAAFWNGIGPFETEPAMIRALHSSDADYLLICRDMLAQELAFNAGSADKLPDWLETAAESGSETLLLRVRKPELAQAAGALPRDDLPAPAAAPTAEPAT